MSNECDPLVLDLVEWVAREPRAYAELMEAWRTSCPRLTIWEDAIDSGFVEHRAVEGRRFVFVTELGQEFLRAQSPSPKLRDFSEPHQPVQGGTSRVATNGSPRVAFATQS